MALARPPFDFDLNELPPPEEDGANDASPDPEREPLQQDPPPPPEREPSPQDLVPPPSPDLDLEAPLSPLYEDEDDADLQLPGPPILPAVPEPRGFASPVATSRSSRSSAEADDGSLSATRLPDPLSRLGERTSPRACLPDNKTERPSSQEMSAPRVPSRGPSDTTSSQRTRHVPPYVSRDDDAISKRRRRGGGYDEDAASYSHGVSGRAGPPSPRRYGQTGGRRLAPAMDGELGGPRPRNRRRRRYGRNQNYGQDQRMKQGYRGREWPQGGFRVQERPPSGRHQAYHGPHGNAPPKFSIQLGSSDFRPSYSGPHGREDSYHRRQNQVQEPRKTGGYQRREAPPFSGAHGREGSFGRRENPVQEPPKIGGHNQQREAPAFRSPPSRARGTDDFYGDRSNPAAQEHRPDADGGYQQREAPRHGRGHAPVRPYHPYARDAGAFDDRANAEKAQELPAPARRHAKQDWRS